MKRSYLSLNTTLLVYLAIFLIGFSLYSRTLSSSFHFDDFDAIVMNTDIRDLGNVKAIWDAFNTRFIAGLSFAFNYHLGKLNVFGYHLFNLFCHLFCALLVYGLVLLTFQTPRMREGPCHELSDRVALFSSLLFLVHPIQTQSINYIWQRVTCLATFFYLASLMLYVKARLDSRLGLCIAALLTTILGMFTKEIMVTLPFIILLYERCFFGPWKEEGRKRLARLIPFLFTLLIIPFMLARSNQVTLVTMKSPSITAPTPETRMLPAIFLRMTKWRAGGALSRKDYEFTQLNVTRSYLRLLFFPVRQRLVYEYPISRRFTEPGVLLSTLLLLAIVISGMIIFQKNRLAAFGIFWFFVTLIPESVIVLPDVIFEHRLYLPTVGFSLFLSSSLVSLVRDIKRSVILFSAIALAFSIATFRRNEVWKDEFTLWQDVIKKSPHETGSYCSLGLAYSTQGNYDKAIECYQKAIDLDPKYSDAYNNLGSVYYTQGNYDKAIEYYQKAIDLDPHSYMAYNNLGAAYDGKGDYHKEIECFQRAVQLKPRYVTPYDNLGVIYDNRGNYDKVIECYQKVIELDPSSYLTYYYLGIVFGKKGDKAGLLKQIDRLRALHQNDLAERLASEFR